MSVSTDGVLPTSSAKLQLCVAITALAKVVVAATCFQRKTLAVAGDSVMGSANAQTMAMYISGGDDEVVARAF